MNLQLKNHIVSYFSDIFIDAVQNFQQLVQKQNDGNEKITLNSYLSVYQGNSKSLVVKQAANLSPGYNKNTAVQLTVLRVLWTKFYTFILCASALPLVHLDDIFCIVIQTTSFQAPYFDIWKKQLGPMAVLLIKQPYFELELINYLQIIRILIQNAQIKKPTHYKAAVNQTKTNGNQCFNKSDYINALHYYEYGLSCCHNYLQANTRAILYSNSAASLYRLNLFESSLKFCSITNRVDINYYKVNGSKIKCLLQKKQFGQIPNLLIILQSNSNSNQFTSINLKYCTYLSNSLGMYNWKAISSQVKQNQQEIIVADYFSKYIGLRIHNDRQIYYALQNLKKHTILVIRKPLIYDKKGIKNKQQLYQKIIKFIKLQKNILPNHNIKLDQKQIEAKIKKYLVQPNQITRNESKALGFWPQLTKFPHTCIPNCSIVHFESVMLVSTCDNISKGETLTVDFVATAPPFERKQKLLQTYNKQCNCAICQQVAWPDMKSKDSVTKFAEFMSNITIRKQIFWEILIKSSNYQMIENQLKVVTKQLNWSDMIRAMKILRDIKEKNSKLTEILTNILIYGFKIHLKIPDQLSLEVINNIR